MIDTGHPHDIGRTSIASCHCLQRAWLYARGRSCLGSIRGGIVAEQGRDRTRGYDQCPGTQWWWSIQVNRGYCYRNGFDSSFIVGEILSPSLDCPEEVLKDEKAEKWEGSQSIDRRTNLPHCWCSPRVSVMMYVLGSGEGE
jgi:hypothetical protein